MNLDLSKLSKKMALAGTAIGAILILVKDVDSIVVKIAAMVCITIIAAIYTWKQGNLDQHIATKYVEDNTDSAKVGGNLDQHIATKYKDE